MIPHIFSSLQGYPGKWVHSLPKGRDISMSDLLAHMDQMFGNICDCHTMIRGLYKICQKERPRRSTCFDMLCMLAKKLETRQPSHSHKTRLGSVNTYRDWYQRYPAPVGKVATLEDEELFLPDPEI